MENLLPKIKDIKEMESTKERTKIKIVNDMVKQAMKYKRYPSNEEEKHLIGDSYTSAKISYQYLRDNKIGEDIRFALALSQPFDKKRYGQTHVILLLEDEEGKTYYYDATPNIGYGNGVVKNALEQDYYEDIIELDYEDLNIIEQLRIYNNRLVNGLCNEEEKRHIENFVNELTESNNKRIQGFVFETGLLLSNIRINSKVDDIKLAEFITNSVDEIDYLKSNNKDYERQQELAQAITSERLKLQSINDEKININGTLYSINYINPRLFYENKLSTVVLNSSDESISQDIIDRYKRESNVYGLTKVDYNISSEEFNLQRTSPVGQTKGYMFITDNIINTKKEEEIDITDPYEASLVYTSYYPEYQVIKESTIPNPVLKLTKKDK